MRLSKQSALYRKAIPSGEVYFNLLSVIKKNKIHTVCEEAKCPNRSECYSQGTLTFQILGNVCTRSCRFCAETVGNPQGVVDRGEPDRILQSVLELGLKYVVITAVARDDLTDGGAQCFYDVISLLLDRIRNIHVEVLTSDMEGQKSSIEKVLSASPNVFNHNIETVRRLTPRVRSKATYDRSLDVLRYAKKISTDGKKKIMIKSGIMVGVGETWQEIQDTISDLFHAGVDCLTIGQYLQPMGNKIPISRLYSAQEFDDIAVIAKKIGFKNVFSGAMVRSSYQADRLYQMSTIK